MIDQGEFFKIPSPCQSICEMNNKGYCIGCFRSRNERLHWNQYSEFQKQLVVNLCHKRKLKVAQVKRNKNKPVVEEAPDAPQLDLFYEVKLDHSTDNSTDTTDQSQALSRSNSKKPPRRDEEQLDLF